MKNIKKGSSLVELLAVIVILGIVAAIAVPTIGSLLKNSRKKAVSLEMVNLVQGVERYLNQCSDEELLVFKQGDNTYKIIGNTSTIAEYFSNEECYNNIVDKSLIVFELNNTGTKVETVVFKDGFAYKKDNRYYKDFTYDVANSSCKVKTETDTL